VTDLESVGLTVLVFASAAAYDLAWVRCVAAVSEGERLRAATWSSTMCLIGLIGLFGVLRSAWLAVPEVAGVFAGTYLGVKPTSLRALTRERKP
jgi:hypothetical protein